MTTLFVAGGGGFLGGAVATAAVAAGYDVHLTWRRRRPTAPGHAHRLDLTDLAAVRALVDATRPEVVVNATGGPHRPLRPAERVAGWRDTVVATAVLLEACRDLGPRFVHIASAHEYAPSSRPHRESDPLAPTSSRGATKLAALVAVRQWAAETGHPTAVVRPFAVYGPGQPHDQLVPTALRAAVTGRPLPVPAVTTRRDFVYVDDVAAAILTAATHPAAVGGEFNLGSGTETTVTELVQRVEEVTGRPVVTVPGTFPPTPGDRRHWVADPSHTRRVLGWSATTGLVAGLASTLAAAR